MEGFGPLVEVDWLAARLGEPGLRPVDFRWYLDGRSGRAAYEVGHIPGAVFVDLEAVTGRASDAGRHPLPERDRFERAMRVAGVDRGTRVVAYDDRGGFSAARLWFLLRYFGHEAAAVLDGGLEAWSGELAAGSETPPEGDFVAGEPRAGMKLDFEQVRAREPGSVLIDARAPERYRGEVEPLDPRAGHIPGARSAPWQGNLGPDGRLRSPEALRARFAGLGIDGGAGVVAYCGSGVNACLNLLALEVAGLRGARLYAGSWSDWSRRPGAPVATGDRP